MKKNVKKKSGFTLIEIMIVISIIVVLAAIAVPKYSSIQKDAKVKADIVSAKVIGDATVALIAQDNITKSDYSTGVGVTEGNEIADYLQTVPVVKAVESGVFKVTIDTDDNVFVTSNDVQLYPTQIGDYPPAPAD